MIADAKAPSWLAGCRSRCAAGRHSTRCSMPASADSEWRVPIQPRRHCFQRFLLPGFAFKAVVIGGGYATGRELAEYLPAQRAVGRPCGDRCCRPCSVQPGLRADLPVRPGQSRRSDYVTFFKELLGPGLVRVRGGLYPVHHPHPGGLRRRGGGDRRGGVRRSEIWGTLALAAAIIAVVTFGNTSVERMFVYVSYLLYARLCAVHHLRLYQFWRPDCGRLRARRTGVKAGSPAAPSTPATTSSARSSCCRSSAI